MHSAALRDLRGILCLYYILYAYIHDERNTQILTWYMIQSGLIILWLRRYLMWGEISSGHINWCEKSTFSVGSRSSFMTGIVRVCVLSRQEITIDVWKYVLTIMMRLGAFWKENLPTLTVYLTVYLANIPEPLEEFGAMLAAWPICQYVQYFVTVIFWASQITLIEMNVVWLPCGCVSMRWPTSVRAGGEYWGP